MEDDPNLQFLAYTNKCIGCLLSGMTGDILGAGVEGLSYSEQRLAFPNGVKDFLDVPHYGIEYCGSRFGMYTDDTNCAIALAVSLLEKKRLDPEHVARMYASFWQKQPRRAYPGTSHVLYQKLCSGVSYLETGRLHQSEGSWSNGGAMRIGPVGLVFRHASDDVIYEAVQCALIATHVHPEAVDSAFVIAKLVAVVVKLDNVENFSMLETVKNMKNLVKTDGMRKNIEYILGEAEQIDNKIKVSDRDVLIKITVDFQSKGIEAVACVLWCLINYWKNPEDCIIKCVELGGDTDTIACMAGYVLGSIHGYSWIPKRWWTKIENDQYGRDHYKRIATQLATLDLRDV